MNDVKRKFWGWGNMGQGLDAEQTKQLVQTMAARFGLSDLTVDPPPRIEEIELRAPRIKPPSALAALCTEDPWERACHTYGKALRDTVRAYMRDFSNPPDQVAFPRSEADVVALLDWCSSERIAAIPYGGGSSVVGGVEVPRDGSHRGAVSIDLKHLSQVLEIDRTSRAAHIQAGVYGPHLEEQLRPHGLTLRHFPQSFEFSTLGGWIATRSGGHYATLYTHIDDFVESLRVVTPTGIDESFRLPGSGAGPSPDRMYIGSEGILGIITSAWMRLQDRPTFRANASVTFPDLASAAEAVRAVGQAGLNPANCRVLDPVQAEISGAGDGSEAILVLGFESADHALDAWMARALECCRDHGGKVPDAAGSTTTDAEVTRQGKTGAWRNAFLIQPYFREVLVGLGVVSSTCETSITWDRFPAYHEAVTAALTKVVKEVCGTGVVACRFTHVYPDGVAPYYTVQGPGKKASMVQQWDEIKAAAGEAFVSNGGTITHHHAVGRDHRPWYDRQRPPGFARALTAAKRALDPAGVLNPGVLIDP